MTDYYDLPPDEKLAVLREQCQRTNMEQFGDNSPDGNDERPAGAAAQGGQRGGQQVAASQFGGSVAMVGMVIVFLAALGLPITAAVLVAETFLR